MLEGKMMTDRIESRPQHFFARSILFVAAFLLYIGGTISISSAQQQWERVPGAASDIALADDGTVWLVGAAEADKVPGGYRIFMINRGAGRPTAVAGGALRIAVEGNTPWVVNDAGVVQRWAAGTWHTISAPKAFDIGASAKGVWIAAEPKRGAHYSLYRQTAGGWHVTPDAASRLDVDASGNSWAVSSDGSVHASIGGRWQQFWLPRDAQGQYEKAGDIAVEVSAPWVATKGGGLWSFNTDSRQWEKRAQAASAVAYRGGNAWYLGAKNEIFRLVNLAKPQFTPVTIAPSAAQPAASTSPFSWVAVSGRNVPGAAVIAGKHKSGANLAVCRADMGDGIHPGKVWGANCVVGWGGREVARPNYEVLSASPNAVKWVATRKGQPMPANAVVAGKHKSGANLAVCRADMGDGIHSGKVWGANCNVGWGGKEVVKADFDVLVSAR